MKKYIVDTNIFLRFVLKDNKKYYKQAKKYILLAKKGKISLLLLPQVVFEIDYVLKNVYLLAKKQRVEILSSLVKSPELKIKERSILIEAVEKYKKLNIDFVDIYLSQAAKQEKAKILSFDKDFKKLK